MNRLALLHQQLKKIIGSRALPFLSIKDNVFTVRDGENEQNVSAMDKENDNKIYVDVHVIDSSLFMSKIYYVEAWDPDSDPVAPTCYSNDGFKPAADAQVRQSEFCAQCPNNVWGSKMTQANKKAKACNDTWKIAVVVPEHHDEKVIQARIPPASLRNWLAYIGQFNDYDYPGQDRKMNVMDVITRIYFESQGVINFIPLSVLEPDSERMAYAQQVIDSKETEVFIGIDNISEEKREEALMLTAPSNVPQVEYHPTKMTPEPKPTGQPKVTFKPKPVEEVAEEEEGDEEDTTPEPAKPASKAVNHMLPSEMRTKKTTATGNTMFKKTAAPAAQNGGKPPVSSAVKGMLGNLMNIKT